MTKFAIHFSFLICGVAYVVERGRGLYFRTLAAFIAGMTVNAIYGLFELLAQVRGVNLDKIVIGTITAGEGGVGGINVYGQVSGVTAIGTGVSSGVYRINALALDPNHLGIMLNVPLLILLPFALGEGVRTRRGVALWLLLAFLELIQLLTLSRSGYFGLAFGLAVLAVPFRRQFFSPRLLVPVGAVAFGLALYVATSHYWLQVFKSRFTLSDRSAQVHYAIFDLVPPVLNLHPFLGLGLNTFSVYYEQQTGLTNWGPHSFYVALIAETGLLGTFAFGVFLCWLFVRLAVLHRCGEVLARLRDPESDLVMRLAWGLTAALVATMASNVFYLTMQFYYFYALVLVIVAAPPLFRPGARRAVAPA
jgi:O-antigen ligase